MRRSFTQAAIIIGIFSALAAAGGLIKIPSPVGSIAFDSAPGYFVAAFYGPGLGAVVGLIGHLASAAVAGMPLGPLHLIVAIVMLAWCYLFGAVSRAGRSVWWVIAGAAVAVLGNGVVTPFLLVPFGLSMNVAIAILPFLVAASALNILVAAIAAWSIARFRPESYSEES
jgi:uncharacterized membrane protein